MHLSSLLLLSLTGTASAAPTEVEVGLVSRGDSSKFPLPYIGESLKDYTQQLLSFLSNSILGPKNLQHALSDILPVFSIDFNCKFTAALSKTDDVPNYNTEFGSVENIDNSRVKWLVEAEGRTEDDPVLLYFHGGGYVLPLLPTQISFLVDAWKQFNVKSDRLSILVLDYSIAPKEGTWPLQLQQGAAVYNELTKSSKNIILTGDSAGGHLSLAMLRHMEYPVDSGQPITQKPQGLIGISPWVNVDPSFDQNIKNGTYATNDGVDYLSVNSLSSMGQLSIPDQEQRLSVELNMWKDHIDWYDLLPEDKSKIFVSYGDNEVLKGDIQSWLRLANLTDSSATIYRDMPGCDKCWIQSGTHDNPYIDGPTSPIGKPLVDFLVKEFA